MKKDNINKTQITTPETDTTGKKPQTSRILQEDALATALKAKELGIGALQRLQNNIQNPNLDAEEFHMLMDDLSFLETFIEELGENFIPGATTTELNKLSQQLNSRQKEIDFAETKDSLDHLEKNLAGLPAGPFEIHMRMVERNLKRYGEDFLPGINTNKLEEKKKQMAFLEAQMCFRTLSNKIADKDFLGAKRDIRFLDDFVKTYGEDAIPELTPEKLQSLTEQSKKILGVTQTGQVKMYGKPHGILFVTPDNGGKDILIENMEGNWVEGDEVKFVVQNEKGEVKLLDEAE